MNKEDIDFVCDCIGRVCESRKQYGASNEDIVEYLSDLKNITWKNNKDMVKYIEYQIMLCKGEKCYQDC